MTGQIWGGGSGKEKKNHVLSSHFIHFIGLKIIFPFNIHATCWHQKHKTKTSELLPQHAKKIINKKYYYLPIYINPHYILIHEYELYINLCIVHICQELPSWFRPASLIMPPWKSSRVQAATNIPGRNTYTKSNDSKLSLNEYLPTCLRATDSKSPSIHEDECSHTQGNTLHDEEGNDAAA